MEQRRLDILLAEKGYAPSRQSAKRMVEEGKVRVNGVLYTKASKAVSIYAEIEAETEKYVSRGAYKLEKAVNEFNSPINGLKFMDCGASTGGFTDYLIQNGAEYVWAVDVGTSQLAESLKNNEKIKSIENTNIRYMEKAPWMDCVDGVVIDVSFISLTIILKQLFEIINKNAYYIALVKPQFEAGRECLSKNGIVKDKKVHVSVIRNVAAFVLSFGYGVRNITFSPIKGGDGNIEYLIYFDKNEKNMYNISERQIDDVVTMAHESLKGGN